MANHWQAWSSDIVNTWRRLIHRPGFTLTSSLMLGLALGANVLAFAIFYGYLIRPLPFQTPDQLVMPREQFLKTGLGGDQVSPLLYGKLKQLPELKDQGLYQINAAPVTVEHAAQVRIFANVTASTFSVLGVKPVLGRTLSPLSDKAGGPREVVLSYAFWQQAFGGRPSALGATLGMNGAVYQIVGVMPKRFVFPIGKVDFWVPLVMTPQMARDHNPNYNMLARMPAGWTLARMDAMLHFLRDRLVLALSPSDQKIARAHGVEISAIPFRQWLLSQVGGATPFWGLLVVTFLLLLIAVVNTLNLALARQRQRFGELALREVLGAGRGAIIRLTLLEYIPILIITGLIAGVAAGYGMHLLHTLQLPSPYSPFRIALDRTAIAYLLAVGVLSMACIACLPLVSAWRQLGRGTLTHELTPRGSAGRFLRNAHRVFGTAQITLAVALVISGVLLAQSLRAILAQPLHFDKARVTVAAVVLPKGADAPQFWQRAEPVLKRLPGAQAVAGSNMIPFFGVGTVSFAFYPGKDGKKTREAWGAYVSREFFTTLGIHPLFGRLFMAAGSPSDKNTVILSEAAAKSLFGIVNVVGKTVNGTMRVIGVVPSIPWQLDPTQDYAGRAGYQPLSEATGRQFIFVSVKSPADPSLLIPSLRQAIMSMQPNAAIYQIRTLTRILHQASLNRTAVTTLVLIFGALAFLIAVFGVYAIFAYSTRMRLFEFAIRQVLGATRSSILGLSLKETATLFVVGGALGIATAYAIAHVLRSQLYGVEVLDPAAYLGSLAVIAAAVFIAAAWPAWRAARRDPADIMRASP